MHRNPPKMLPTWSLEASKTSQNTPKRLPRRPKMAPKRHQDAPSSTQDAPSSTQDAPKTSPRRPRCLQERPRIPKMPPRAPKKPPSCLKNLSMQPQAALQLDFWRFRAHPFEQKIIEHGFANSNLFDVNTLVQV